MCAHFFMSDRPRACNLSPCSQGLVSLPHGLQLQYMSGAPRWAFQQPVDNKSMVQCLRVLAILLSAVHNGFCLTHLVAPSVNRTQHPMLIGKCVGFLSLSIERWETRPTA